MINNIIWKIYSEFPKYLFYSNGEIKNTITKKLVVGSSKDGYNRINILNKQIY